VGVAGGLPPQNLVLGDVVVSSHIWGYEYGKIEHGFKPRNDHMFSADGSLLRCAFGFSCTNQSWRNSFGIIPPQTTTSKVLRGPVASGEKVVDDADDAFFRAVTDAWPKLQAVEMEGAGAGAAIRHLQDAGKQVGFLMIRGISDTPRTASARQDPVTSQTQERDNWKEYAANAAAAFATEFIRTSWPVPPKA
jgi:nucleoside phosphorylase